MGHTASPDIILKIRDQFKYKSKGNDRKWKFLFDKYYAKNVKRRNF